MPLINGKVELSLKWIENCVLTASANANKTTFEITDAKRYVPIFTLSAEDNAKLSKLLGKGIKISIYWNKYKVIDNRVVAVSDANVDNYIRKFKLQAIRESKDCLFLLIIRQKVIIKLLLIPLENIFFHKLK